MTLAETEDARRDILKNVGMMKNADLVKVAFISMNLRIPKWVQTVKKMV